MSNIFKSCLHFRYKTFKFQQFSTIKKNEYLKRPLVQVICGVTGIGVISGIAYALIKTKSSFKNSNLRSNFNFINKVVEKCAAGVVFVEIINPKNSDRNVDRGSVVSNGSGFIVSDDGWILTNAHVVLKNPNAIIEVGLHDGRTYKAYVIDADMNLDLAIIKIEPEQNLSPLKLAKSGDVSVGEWVVALGSPLSLSHSATAGVVSSVSRGADELGLRNYNMRYIQTDAPITFGNSGGPLVNLDGDVIGVNNLRITAGISFAIPIEYGANYLDRIRSLSSQPPKINSNYQLGIVTLKLTPDIVELVQTHQKSEIKISEGIFIWKLIPKSLMEQMGFKVGDVITHVDGTEVKNAQEFYKNFNWSNKSFLVDVVRDGKRIKVGVEPQK